MYFFSRQAWDLAIAEFEQAVSMATFPLAALDINLGATFLAKGMHAEARAWLEKGVAIDPDDQQGHWLLARALQEMGAVFEARGEFEQAYALDPDSLEGRQAEAEILRLRARLAPFPILEPIR